MSFATAVRRCLANYATFSGRASRPEFWYFALFVVLGGSVAALLDAALLGAGRFQAGPGRLDARADGPLATLFGLAMVVPHLAAAWRRMHDTGRSGIFVLYPLLIVIGIGSFMSLAGAIAPQSGPAFGGAVAALVWLSMLVLVVSPLIVLWWLARPSQPGPNAYGPAPASAFQR